MPCARRKNEMGNVKKLRATKFKLDASEFKLDALEFLRDALLFFAHVHMVFSLWISGRCIGRKSVTLYRVNGMML